MHVFTPPISNIQETATPREYFFRYFPNNTFEVMAEKTNLYAVQNNVPHFPSTDSREMRKFVGIQILMGNLQHPRVRLYWDQKLGIPIISRCMPVNRFFKLRSTVHIVNVQEKPQNNDRFWKIRPFYDNIRRRCLALPLESNLCVDEQMVPFKGHINVRQYMKDKPCKWGIKIFNLCGASGALYDFIIYQGSTTELNLEYNVFGVPAATVMTLLRRVPSKGHFIYFDNWFSSYQLLQWLKEKDLYAGCTVRLDRFGKVPKKKKKELNSLPRGSSHEYISTDGIVLTQWIDRKPVNMASNYVGKGREDTCERWVKKEIVPESTPAQKAMCEKELKSFSRPEIVRNYNQSMGGVDRLDQLISLYRTFIQSRKWTLRMMTHAFDLALALAWLEYNKECETLNIAKRQRLDLIHFRYEVAESLMKADQVSPLIRRPGRPPSHSPSPSPSPSLSSSPFSSREGTPMREVRTNIDVRLDELAHWPALGGVQRCKNEKCNQRTVYFCTKYNVHLCLVRERNCFVKYHTK